MDMKWTETDPATGKKRIVFAERFGGYWKFRMRSHRRGDSKRIPATRAMWEEVLDTLERRYRRREGVSEVDLEQVRTILTELKEAPTIEAE